MTTRDSAFEVVTELTEAMREANPKLRALMKGARRAILDLLDLLQDEDEEIYEDGYSFGYDAGYREGSMERVDE